jgi:hypothetical protein
MMISINEENYLQALMDLVLLFPDRLLVEVTKVKTVIKLFTKPKFVVTLASTKTAKVDQLKAAREIKAELIKLTTRKTNLDAYAPIDHSHENYAIIKKKICDRV